MSSSDSSKSEPTLITLDNTNSIQIIAQYVEMAQQKGAFLLPEAEILKRGIDVLINNIPDKEINELNAKQLLIQGVQKGQRHGAYTLNDAALLNKVVQFVVGTFPKEEQGSESVSTEAGSASTSEVSGTVASDDLSDLAEPIPLKPKEV